MPERTKRRYDGRLRAERAAATRRRIIEVAIEAFATRGYALTTMADLAAGAGCSVDTVHANGPKAALLQAAVRVAIFGIESDQPIEDYEVGRRLLESPDPATFLDVLVETFADAIPRLAPLWAAVESASDTDSEVTERRDQLLQGAVETLHTIVRTCEDRGWLRGDLPREQRLAALYTVSTPGVLHLVMRDLGVDADGYVEWMRRTVEWALFDGPPDGR